MEPEVLSVSVAMTTYNGANYLYDQLYSLYEQSYPIDELIICDDGSTDLTETIALSFIDRYNLSDKWQFIKNVANMGPMQRGYYFLFRPR